MNSFPEYFEIETSHACNAKCKMCTINQWRGVKDPIMSDEVFFKVADEIIENKDTVKVVDLARDGEPLLDMDIPGRIEYLKNNGIRHVNLSTNASLLNEDLSVELMEAGLDEIMFSVDGYTKKTFESIREGLSFYKVKNNILRFIRLRDVLESPIRIRLRYVLQEENKNEVKQWANYWKSLLWDTDEVYSKRIHNWGNQLNSNIEVINNEACISPFTTMVIKYNGDVTICPIDFNCKYVNGNILTDTIRNIWNNGKFYDMFRKIHKSGRRNMLKYCKGCTLWDNRYKVIY